MEIRRATAADEPSLRALWDAAERELDFTPYAQAGFTPELLADHIVHVAEAGGEIVGSVYAAMPGPEHGFVFGLYVVPAARRQGIARALMAAAAEELRKQGRDYVVLSVDTPNAPARAMYEALGFVDQARILRADVGRLLE